MWPRVRCREELGDGLLPGLLGESRSEEVSGILWEEMLKQGMARSRGEVKRMVGKHMFRLVSRQNAGGFDQLRCWGEIPVTEPEDAEGCVRVSLRDLADDSRWETGVYA